MILQSTECNMSTFPSSQLLVQLRETDTLPLPLRLTGLVFLAGPLLSYPLLLRMHELLPSVPPLGHFHFVEEPAGHLMLGAHEECICS